MSFEYTIYGDVRFDVDYNDAELNNLILSYIRSKKDEGSFTYLRLCKSLINAAVKDGRLVGVKPNTYYQSLQLKSAQYTRISMLLWNFILKGVIYIDFYNNEYVAHIPNDTTFGINKEKI